MLSFTFIFLLTSIYLSIERHDFTLTPPVSVQHHRVHSTFLQVSYSNDGKKIWVLSIPNIAFFLIHLWVCNLIPYCCTLFSPVQKFTLPCSSSNTLHQVTLHRCIFQPALTLTPSPGLVPSLPHCGHSPHPPLDLKTYFEPPLLRDICVTWLQKKNYIAGLRLLSFEEATCQVGS